MHKKWTEKEYVTLVEKYSIVEAKDLAILLNRSLKSVQCKIGILGLIKIWSDKEIEILKEFYPKEGCLVQKRLPNRSKASVNIKSRLLKIRNINKLASQKQIIKDLGNYRIIANCKKHEDTIFYYYGFGKSSRCIKCHRENLKKYRKSTTGNHKSRIQTSLRSCVKGKISFSKHLPYNAKELNNYLENIKLKQNNCCPMCNISYDINPFDIDHIIPQSIAKNKKELISLYRLENLSLLCYRCNRFVKRNKIMIEGEK